MGRYLDIHTHSVPDSGSPVTAIVNLDRAFERVPQLPFCSIGLHPRYLEAGDARGKLAALTEWAVHPHVKAIGECGLDKLAATPWALQKNMFMQQIGLAIRVNKPLIVHCVRAYEEVFRCLKGVRQQVPVIFHGYDKSLQLAKRIWADGYYTSFGGALLKSTHPAAGVLSAAPAEQIFLETDNTELSIQQVYTIAAEIRKTEPEVIILQLQKNFQKVFS